MEDRELEWILEKNHRAAMADAAQRTAPAKKRGARWGILEDALFGLAMTVGMYCLFWLLYYAMGG